MRLVIVDWTDACGPHTSWVSKTDLQDLDLSPVHCKTVGWIVRETETHIEIAQSVAEYGATDDQLSGIMTIPRGCVMQIRSLLLTSRI